MNRLPVEKVEKAAGRAETMKTRIAAAIQGTGNALDATVETVTELVASVIEETGRTAQAVSDVVADVTAGAIEAAVHVGADLGHVTRGVMIGVSRAMKGVHREGLGDDKALDTIRLTARVAIRDIARVGGDMEAATVGLVEGAIDSAKELGVRVEVAAATAAAGAMKGASREGPLAEEAVRRVVRRPIKGITPMLDVPDDLPPPVKAANRMLHRPN
ncbi:hypothetical protein SAMN05444156_1182 [Verrucomicrobium sp. GAS474]|uniref:hypothetical protein n=1 Tax=Verrucomicrobium sp. GAS474 TaxID=1882831 RepID=UPI00087D667D|nr:hypothetical protein [Verrucomicrobium sp. GAS474]SDT97415.1 hypothetical protein SAMN05444156_1182 [Verrucomicrobium sp. GAS474]